MIDVGNPDNAGIESVIAIVALRIGSMPMYTKVLIETHELPTIIPRYRHRAFLTPSSTMDLFYFPKKSKLSREREMDFYRNGPLLLMYKLKNFHSLIRFNGS